MGWLHVGMDLICQEKPVTVTEHSYSKSRMDRYLRCCIYSIVSLYTQFVSALEICWTLLMSFELQ